MKTKNRLLLTSSLMLALVAVSGTTATYAWFTQTVSADLTGSGGTAAADGNLNITYTAKRNCTDTSFKAESEQINSESGLGKNAFKLKLPTTDVTTKDGNSFNKAVFDGNNTINKLIAIPTTSNTKYDYYTEFSMSIDSLGTTTAPYGLFIADKDNAHIIEPANDETASLNLADSIRVGFFNGVDTSSTLKTTYARFNSNDIKDENIKTDKTEAQTQFDTLAKNIFKSQSGIEDTNKEEINGKYLHGYKTKGDTSGDYNKIDKLPSYDDKVSSFLGDLSPSAATTFTVKIWIEGSDSDCTNTALTGSVNFNFNFYVLQKTN